MKDTVVNSYSRKIASFALLIAGALLFSGCGEEQVSKQNDYELAVHFIENQNYSAAIELTSDLVEKDPKDKRARVLMASAYAGRAGIMMRNYTDLAMELIDSTEESRRLFEERGVIVFQKARARVSNENDIQLVESLEKAYRAIWQVSELIRAFEKLPRLASLSQVEDAEKAVEILSSDKSMTGGAVLYRGLIRLAVFRYQLENNYDLLRLDNCRLQIKRLGSQLNDMKIDISSILADFSKGTLDRSRQSEIDKANRDMQVVFNDAANWLNAIGADAELDVSSLSRSWNGSCR